VLVSLLVSALPSAMSQSGVDADALTELKSLLVTGFANANTRADNVDLALAAHAQQVQSALDENRKLAVEMAGKVKELSDRFDAIILRVSSLESGAQGGRAGPIPPPATGGNSVCSVPGGFASYAAAVTGGTSMRDNEVYGKRGRSSEPSARVSWADQHDKMNIEDEEEELVPEWRVQGGARARPKARPRSTSIDAPHTPPQSRSPEQPVLLRLGPFEGDLTRHERNKDTCAILSRVIGREFRHTEQHRIWVPKRFGNFVLIACPDKAAARSL